MDLTKRQFSITRRVRHVAENMFSLVADVGSYPHFVPLCESLIVLDTHQKQQGQETLICEMGIGYGAIHEKFISQVLLQPVHRRISVSHVSGLFSSLDNRWSFHPLEGGEGCDINFFMSYGFASVTFQLLTGAIFDNAFLRFVDAFESRADEIYGCDSS